MLRCVDCHLIVSQYVRANSKRRTDVICSAIPINLQFDLSSLQTVKDPLFAFWYADEVDTVQLFPHTPLDHKLVLHATIRIKHSHDTRVRWLTPACPLRQQEFELFGRDP